MGREQLRLSDMKPQRCAPTIRWAFVSHSQVVLSVGDELGQCLATGLVQIHRATPPNRFCTEARHSCCKQSDLHYPTLASSLLKKPNSDRAVDAGPSNRKVCRHRVCGHEEVGSDIAA